MMSDERETLVDGFVRGLRSSATRDVYRRTIRAFAAFLTGSVPSDDPAALRRADAALLRATRRDVERYRELVEQDAAPATVAKALSALTAFYGWLVDEGKVDRNPAAQARRPKVAEGSPRRGLSIEEVLRILAACERGVGPLIAARDRALVVILAVQGLRISEALGIRVEDLAEEQGVRVATIRRKGGKVVRVPLAAVTTAALDTWATAAGITEGPIFLAVHLGGELTRGAAITRKAAWQRIRTLAERAGLSRDVHPHLFRHGAVTESLAHGIPLHLVQSFAGHADPRTTQRYNAHREALTNPTAHVLGGLVDAGEKDR